MTYLIGVILVLLFIALVLVFRPPKSKPYNEDVHQEAVADGSTPSDDQLDLDIESGGKQTAVAEEELDLAFDEPETDKAEDAAEPVDDLDLVFEDEDDGRTEEKGRDEYDEDIPFIVEGDGAFERKGEMEVAPALADVPDGYAQIDEDETPEELAERLEFFLGTGDEESDSAVEEPAAEQIEDTGVNEKEEDAVEETVEPQEVVKEGPGAGPEGYSEYIQEQFERLRNEMNAAIENRETGKLASLEVALENLCGKQADIQAGFQQQQMLLDELEGVVTDVKEVLPGFQQETVQSSLRAGEYEVVRTLLTEVANQLNDSPQLAARMLYLYGRIEEEGGELSAALEMYTKARAADDENFDYQYAAGRIARITGDTDNAVSILEKRVNAGQEKGEESVELARAEYELARALIMVDEKDRVEQLLIHARDIMEKVLGSGHPALGPVFYELAALHDSSGRYEQAEPLYMQSIEVTEKGLGKDSPHLGSTLYKLAGLYEEIEKDEETEPLYTRALEIKKKVLGENHPDVGTILGHLANLRKKQGKYDEAESMFKKSLAIAEVALGKDHPNLAVVLNDMAELYSEMGNEEQAANYQERAFALFGLPGMGDGFVEMDKDTGIDGDDDQDQVVAGS